MMKQVWPTMAMIYAKKLEVVCRITRYSNLRMLRAGKPNITTCKVHV